MMMATAPPISADPSQIRLAMPTSSPAPIHSKSRVLDILKIFLGFLIALILCAILAVFVFVPPTSNGIDLHESNEKIAKLQRESNENIARLQREQQINIEKEQQERQEMLIEKHRLEDRLIEEKRREQDILFAMEQSRHQLEIEQKRLQLLLEERIIAEEHRKEDLSRENDNLLSDFMGEVMLSKQPLNASMLELKVHSLIRRFDSTHKSLLISFLYKIKLLNVGNPDNTVLDLQGADLRGLDLDGTDIDSGQVGHWLNYTQLALPSTDLINASFEHIYLNEADFRLSNMMGVSFRWSKVIRANFSQAILSLGNFRYANVSQSNFSSTKIERASFQNADLSQAYMTDADLSSTNFQYVIAVETGFSWSRILDADFQYADLSQAQMDDTSIRSSNFYNVKAVQTNFTRANLASCLFQWSDLTNASFRNAFLAGANFQNANVQDADFTGAFLAGANITSGQLDVVLSIAQARLPDGSTGKNKNLVKNANAQCTEINSTILNWVNNGNVFVNKDQISNECVFQAKVINATIQQTIDIRRYERLIKDRQGKVYIQMQDKTISTSNPSVYMIIRFLDSENLETRQEISSLNTASLTSSPTFTAILPCPSTTVELQLTIVFRQANATVNNIYVTIE